MLKASICWRLFYVIIQSLFLWSEKCYDKWRFLFNSCFNLDRFYYVILYVEWCFKCLQVGTEVSLFAYLLLYYIHLDRKRIFLFCVYKSNTLRNYSDAEEYKMHLEYGCILPNLRTSNPTQYAPNSKLISYNDMHNLFTQLLNFCCIRWR